MTDEMCQGYCLTYAAPWCTSIERPTSIWSNTSDVPADVFCRVSNSTTFVVERGCHTKVVIPATVPRNTIAMAAVEEASVSTICSHLDDVIGGSPLAMTNQFNLTLEQCRAEATARGAPAFEYRRGSPPYNNYTCWIVDNTYVQSGVTKLTTPRQRKVYPGWSGYRLATCYILLQNNELRCNRRAVCSG